jgi:hypothetical protein
MSRENGEIARRWCTAMTGGAEEARAAVEALADPDVDYYPVRKFPEAQPCHGREALHQFIVRYLDAYAQTEFAVRQVIEVGDDRVLVSATIHAEGRGSGMKLEGDVYNCFWLRHGCFFRIEDHITLSGALHALGLEGDSLEAVGLSD